ncbi:MAG: TetR/AcrR family transcriptional regulator [Myxococcota bacterium]
MARSIGHDPEVVRDGLLSAFLHGGFDGTSFSDLETATGLDRGQLSRMYGSKRDLFLIALRRTVAQQHEEWFRPVAEQGGIREIRELLLSIAGIQAVDGGPIDGCLVCNTCREPIATNDPEVKRLIHLHFASVEKTFSSALKRSVAHGELSLDKADVRKSARMFYGVTVGLLVLVRAGEAPSTLRDIAQRAVASIS